MGNQDMPGSPVESPVKKEMRCYCCDLSEWHKVTVPRNGKAEPIHSLGTIQVCKNCGNACFEVDASQEEKIKAFYRKEYRPQPTIMNLLTTTHKLNYVRVFMREFIEANKGRQLVVGDVGAATGYMLNFFRSLGHKVCGSELTLTYRRMSEHYYGIPLAEELEPKHKYDLIVVYHVLEHLIDPDRKLAKYASMLADGGKLLVATPQWFDWVEDASGEPVKTFDYLFHKNHINLFSGTSLQNVFRKCGLTVVKEDHLQYGQTYLLEKKAAAEGEPLPQDRWLTKEEWREVVRTMLNHEHAINLSSQGKYREATNIVPRFPEAWLNMIFGKYTKDAAKQEDLLAEAEAHIGENYRFILAKAQWLYQHGRLGDAISGFRKVLALKPNEDVYTFLGYALAQTGQTDEAAQCMQIAATMDPRKWTECQGWLLQMACSKPTWDERLLQEAAASLSVKPEVQPQGA